MVMELIAGGMLYRNTPVQHYPQYNLFVKREDLACPPPGPAFSKTRGVYTRVKSRPEKIIGVLDTNHSQAGHAVARACQILGKKCINFYPHYKADTGLRAPQVAALKLGAQLCPLPAGRSCILFHAARKETEKVGGYMMPNALKLNESVDETASEVPPGEYDYAIIPISSGTIAAGVIKGFGDRVGCYLIHMGYSRSHTEVLNYLAAMGRGGESLESWVSLIDEEYAYKDKANTGPTPPWPCNAYYDLKAFRWWMAHKNQYPGKVLFWNVG